MKNLLYILTFIVTTAAIAQSTNTIVLEKQKLKQAIAYGDKAVATSTMYSIINLEGSQSIYKDSLAYLYFDRRNYVSCFLVTNDILKNKPNNIELLEMQAISLESMGAIENYKTLVSKTNNNYQAYKLAALQFTSKKYENALESIKKSDQLPDTGTSNITFQVNKNYNQNVNLKAAIAYLEGMILLKLEKTNEAKLSFKRAIKLFPEFVLAKGKLSTLEKAE